MIEAVNGFKEPINRIKSYDAADQKNRWSTLTPSGVRTKMENNEKKKGILTGLPQVKFRSSYHDSSVDKVWYT